MPRIITTIRFSPQLLARLDRIAAHKGTYRSRVVEEALVRFVRATPVTSGPGDAEEEPLEEEELYS